LREVFKMKKMRKKFTTMIWYCCIIGVITLGLVSIVGTGGSDDDGGGGSDILPVYNFTIDMNPVQELLAEPQGVSAVPDKPGPLSVAISYEDINYLVEVSGIIEGSMNTGDGGYTIGDTTSVQIVDVGGIGYIPFYLGNLTINVTADIVIPDDGPPTSGGWTVQSESMAQAAEIETITVTVVVTPEPGVTITTSDQTQDPYTVTMTWETLDALIGSQSAPYWVQKAAYASEFFQFMLDEQTPLLVGTFDEIIPALEDALEMGLLVEGDAMRDSCYAFPEGQNPVGVPQEGYNDFTWYDVSDNDEVGPGDSFNWDFYYCWNDALFHGDIDLRGYTNVEDGGTITRIGYEPYEGPGGVYFDNFTISEIRYEVDGPYTIDTVFTLNGGFTIVFYEPVVD
jgi:hypothetical protein